MIKMFSPYFNTRECERNIQHSNPWFKKKNIKIMSMKFYITNNLERLIYYN